MYEPANVGRINGTTKGVKIFYSIIWAAISAIHYIPRAVCLEKVGVRQVPLRRSTCHTPHFLSAHNPRDAAPIQAATADSDFKFQI